MLGGGESRFGISFKYIVAFTHQHLRSYREVTVRIHGDLIVLPTWMIGPLALWLNYPKTEQTIPTNS